MKQSVHSWSLGAGVNGGPLLRSIDKAGQNLRRRFYAQGDLGNCIGKREKLWFGNDRTARLAGLYTTMPSVGRRAGTNSVPAGSCLNPDDRFTSGPSSGFAMRSMISSVWNHMRHHDRRCGGIVTATRLPVTEFLRPVSMRFCSSRTLLAPRMPRPLASAQGKAVTFGVTRGCMAVASPVSSIT